VQLDGGIGVGAAVVVVAGAAVVVVGCNVPVVLGADVVVVAVVLGTVVVLVIAGAAVVVVVAFGAPVVFGGAGVGGTVSGVKLRVRDGIDLDCVLLPLCVVFNVLVGDETFSLCDGVTVINVDSVGLDWLVAEQLG
jgi:hypothetical protein